MKKIVFLLLVTLTSSLGSAQEIIEMWVKENKANCTGVAPMECLQVKYGNEKDWELFYSSIEGFDYTAGYRYHLKVVKSKRPAPVPADASAYTYTLQKVLSKEKIKIPSFAQKKVVLTQLNGKKTNANNVYLTFDYNLNSINGKSGCNTFAVDFTQVKSNRIQTGLPIGTMMACDPETMQLEHAFLMALHKQEYVIKHRRHEITLTSKDKKNKMVFKVIDNGDIWNYIGQHRWKLIQLDGVGKEYGKAMIQFDITKQTVNGNASCNSFFGSYAAKGNNITFKGMGTTRMLCANDEANQTENRLLTLFNSSGLRFDVADQTLNFYLNNRLVMMFAITN